MPPASAITSEEHHGITDCHRCGNGLIDKDEAVRYEEDIVLAVLTPEVPHKTVTKYTVEHGWCTKCGQYSSAKDLRGQEVTLGPNVRSLIVYLVVQADQTYAQTQDLLWQLYRFTVTDGEIANILAARVKPTCQPTNSSSKAFELAQLIWMKLITGFSPNKVPDMPMSWPVSSTKTLADGRGKGHSQDLVGNNYRGIGITDRLGNYKHLFLPGCHQICWAHLQRTARDLTRLECLTKAKQKHVTKYYQELATIYSCIRTYQAEPFVVATRQVQANVLLEQTKELCQPHALDPKELADLKAGILEYQDCLFVCLSDHPWYPRRQQQG